MLTLLTLSSAKLTLLYSSNFAEAVYEYKVGG